MKEKLKIAREYLRSENHKNHKALTGLIYSSLNKSYKKSECCYEAKSKSTFSYKFDSYRLHLLQVFVNNRKIEILTKVIHEKFDGEDICENSDANEAGGSDQRRKKRKSENNFALGGVTVGQNISSFK